MCTNYGQYLFSFNFGLWSRQCYIERTNTVITIWHLTNAGTSTAFGWLMYAVVVEGTPFP